MKPHLPPSNGGDKTNPDKKSNQPGADPKRVALAVATILVLSLLLSIHLLPSRVTLKPGDVAPNDIRAHRRASYTDTAELERMRLQAAASVGRVYDPDPGAADQAESAVRTICQAVEQVRAGYSHIPIARQVKRVEDRLGPVLRARVSSKTFQTLLQMDDNSLREVKENTIQSVSAAMTRPVYDYDMRAARDRVMAEAAKLFKDRRTAEVVGEIASGSLRPNQIYNQEVTLDAQRKASSEVQSDLRVIEPGALIIAKGETVFQKHIEKFDALGLRNPRLDYRSVGALTLFVIVAVLLVMGYLAYYHEDVYRNTTALLLLALIVVVSVAALRVSGTMLGVKLSSAQVGYLGTLWITAAAMLMAVLVNPQVAIVVSALLSMVLSLMLNSELRYAATALVTSMVGIFGVANIRDRGDMLRAVGLLGASGFLMVCTTGGLSGDSGWQMLSGAVWAGVIAIAAVSVFWIATPILEKPFGRTTHMTLLELADTNRTLLRRLVMEAPGTYTHSVAVGHLAETAAEAIGADSLVARVASYYHDIGKIKRPHFFVENQHVENVHDRINPTLSALVITSHIKDGLEVAKDHRLPAVVLDVIRQHHGTSLVQYFYNQATGDEEGSNALESQFRYSGPRPQSREAAIVMLADSVEAGSRCITQPTQAKIELLVNRIVADKLRDGQLSESDLTFKEMGKVSESFVRTLTGTLHARIDYPDAPAANGKRTVTYASTDTRQPKGAPEQAAAEGAGRKAASR